MASLPVRDPIGDHLLTPQNATLVVIDYQPSQFAGVTSMDQDTLLENVVSTVKTAKAFDCRSSTRPSTSQWDEGSRRFQSLPSCSTTIHRSTERRPTRGRTATSSQLSVPPDGAS